VSVVCVMLYILLVAWAYVFVTLVRLNASFIPLRHSTLDSVVQLLGKSFKMATEFPSLFRFDLFGKVLYSRAFLSRPFVPGP
jgi:hypothetical protein